MNDNERCKNLPNTIVFDVMEYARNIENALKDYLKPYQKGIYSDRSFDPVAPLNAALRMTKHGNSILASTPSGPSIIGKWRESPEGTVLPNFFVTPQIPVHGLQIVKSFVEQWIHRDLKWIRNRPSFSEILEQSLKQSLCEEFLTQQYISKDNEVLTPPNCDVLNWFRYVNLNPGIEIVPNSVFLNAQEYVVSIMRGIVGLLTTYTEHDEWGVYDIKLGISTMTITRIGDYRIQDWTSKFGHLYE